MRRIHKRPTMSDLQFFTESSLASNDDLHFWRITAEACAAICHLVLIILVPSRITSFNSHPELQILLAMSAITLLFHILYLVGLLKDKPFYVFDVGRETRNTLKWLGAFSPTPPYAPIVAYPKLQSTASRRRWAQSRSHILGRAIRTTALRQTPSCIF